MTYLQRARLANTQQLVGFKVGNALSAECTGLLDRMLGSFNTMQGFFHMNIGLFL